MATDMKFRVSELIAEARRPGCTRESIGPYCDAVARSASRSEKLEVCKLIAELRDHIGTMDEHLLDPVDLRRWASGVPQVVSAATGGRDRCLAVLETFAQGSIDGAGEREEGTIAARMADSEPLARGQWIDRRIADFSRAADRYQLAVRIERHAEGEIVASRQQETPRGGLRIISWHASWRNAKIWVLHGPPPFSFDGDGQKQRCPESKHPRPWGWFDPDSVDGEVGSLIFTGTHEAQDRYFELAAACWREVSGAPLAGEVQDLVGRTRLVGAPSDDDLTDAIRWTMFMLLVAWSPNKPAALSAKRWSWIPGRPFRVAADGPLPPGETIDPEVLKGEFGIGPSQLPESWKHFEAELRPGAFTASAAVLAWVGSSAQRIEESSKPAGAESAGATDPTDPEASALSNSDNWKPATWFKKGASDWLRSATRPERKRKRVRFRVHADGTKLYYVPDVRQFASHWLPERA